MPTRKFQDLLDEMLVARRERIDKNVQRDLAAYLDRYGWDIVEDEARWRRHQRRRMSEEYRIDKW